MDTRDYIILGIITGLIVWFFCARKRAGCGCSKAPAAAPPLGQGSMHGKGCGPFACGGQENLRAPMAQGLRRV
jgi:hypothetical protein